jgi:hypothetical protein
MKNVAAELKAKPDKNRRIIRFPVRKERGFCYTSPDEK